MFCFSFIKYPTECNHEGIPVGLFTGLVTYIATNKPLRAFKVSVGSFSVITLGYFVKCRIEFNKKVEQNKELGQIMDMIIKYRGTELESQFQQRYTEKLKEMDTKSKYV